MVNVELFPRSIVVSISKNDGKLYITETEICGFDYYK